MDKTKMWDQNFSGPVFFILTDNSFTSSNGTLVFSKAGVFGIIIISFNKYRKVVRLLLTVYVWSKITVVRKVIMIVLFE